MAQSKENKGAAEQANATPIEIDLEATVQNLEKLNAENAELTQRLEELNTKCTTLQAHYDELEIESAERIAAISGDLAQAEAVIKTLQARLELAEDRVSAPEVERDDSAGLRPPAQGWAPIPDSPTHPVSGEPLVEFIHVIGGNQLLYAERTSLGGEVGWNSKLISNLLLAQATRCVRPTVFGDPRLSGEAALGNCPKFDEKRKLGVAIWIE